MTTVSPNDILSPYQCWLPAQILRVISPGEWIIGLGDGLRTGGWRIRIIDGCDELDANGARAREGDLLEVQVEVTPCLVDGRLTIRDRRLLGIRMPVHGTKKPMGTMKAAKPARKQVPPPYIDPARRF